VRIASSILIACLGLVAACGGTSKAAEPKTGSSMENTGGDGGDSYGKTTGGYEDDKEPCEEEQSE
jgi:hypothetical protein